MDRIEALRAFIMVAEEQGFSRAAAELGVSKSAASRQISGLEAALGAPLLKRTTRHVELTEAGQAYLERVKAILADLEIADRAVSTPQNDLAGPIRIAAPVDFGTTRLAPIMAAFLAGHPKLVAEVVLNDRYVDPEVEGFDLVLSIRQAGSEPDDGLRLWPVETGLFASPDYIARHGRPQAPSDLARHPALCVGARQRTVAWHLRGQAEPVTVTPRLSGNHTSIVREAALAALGVALLPAYVAADDVKAGRLLRVLDGFEPKPEWLCVAYREGPVLSEKCRMFIDFLVERLRRGGG